MDRRSIPEEDVAVVEAEVRQLIAEAAATQPGIGVAVRMCGAGPRTLLESNAKRADAHLVLEDLRRATQVVARTLADLLG